jgi:hypothetical protein
LRSQITQANVEDLDCWRIKISLPRADLQCKLPHSLKPLRVGSALAYDGGLGGGISGNMPTTTNAAAAMSLPSTPAPPTPSSLTGPLPRTGQDTAFSAVAEEAGGLESGRPSPLGLPPPSSPPPACASGGYFWNYVSVGLDAKAAYGFHHLREQRPWAASNRMANQFWYSTFACTSGERSG